MAAVASLKNVAQGDLSNPVEVFDSRFSAEDMDYLVGVVRRTGDRTLLLQVAFAKLGVIMLPHTSTTLDNIHEFLTMEDGSPLTSGVEAQVKNAVSLIRTIFGITKKPLMVRANQLVLPVSFDDGNVIPFLISPYSRGPNKCFACWNFPKEGKLKRCATCREVKYCSPECQLADWKSHKVLCEKKE